MHRSKRISHYSSLVPVGTRHKEADISTSLCFVITYVENRGAEAAHHGKQSQPAPHGQVPVNICEEVRLQSSVATGT